MRRNGRAIGICQFNGLFLALHHGNRDRCFCSGRRNHRCVVHPAEWSDELWAMSASLLDAFIRTCHGIYQFTDDPSCVLRVGLSPARATISLSDGTRIEGANWSGPCIFGTSICRAIRLTGLRSRLGLHSAPAGAPFALLARRLCRERARLAADTGASRRGRTVGPARDSAWPNDLGLNVYRPISLSVGGFMPSARALPCGL
jgi:hypothetical protein